MSDAAQPVCLGLSYNPGDLGPWANHSDAVIVLFHNWVNSYNYIRDFDAAQRRITFSRPAGMYFLGPHVRYYVENVFAALDEPGAWYLDPQQGQLYYYPLAGEDLAHCRGHRPAAYGNAADDPRRSGGGPFCRTPGVPRPLLPACRRRPLPRLPVSSARCAGAPTQRGAIFAVGLRQAVIENCEFAHLGEHAISLREGCQGNVVRQCHIFDLGGGGIYLSAEWPQHTSEALLTAHDVVDNNFIHDNGHIFRAGCGVFLGGNASYNEITHNEICNQNWVGIHVGWSWSGKVRTSTHHNTVAYNHIHHLGNGVLNDLAGIYTLGDSPGTVLHHNLIHDITRFERGTEGYGGQGIYLDSGSSEIRVENNVVYRTRDGGLFVNCSLSPHADIVVNNIFAFSDRSELDRDVIGGEPEAEHVYLERNIVVPKNNGMFAGIWRKESKFSSDRNCFWSASGEAADFLGKTFAQWQAMGHDQHSLVADPGFLDPGQGDFRLRAGSPALALGFQPIDVSTAGLYGGAAWTRLPGGFPPHPVEKAVPVAAALADDFENYPVGARPDEAQVFEGAGGGSIRVSDDYAAAGRQSLKFVGGSGPHAAGQPSMYYPTWMEADRVQGRFDLRLEPGAALHHDWRQKQNDELPIIGPALRVHADGALLVDGRKLAELPQRQWVELQIVAGLGGKANGRWQLTVRIAGRQPQVFPDLPCDPRFKRLTWYGFSSLANKSAVFYLDNILVEPLVPLTLSATPFSEVVTHA